jgi:hypothetical protein
MTIFQFSLVILFVLTTPSTKGTDEKENQTHHVKTLKFLDDLKNVMTCEVTFPTQDNSLNHYFLKDSQELEFPRSFKIEGSPSHIQIHDLREKSKWKTLDIASLKYEIHLKHVIQPIVGIIDNVFTPFIEKESSLEPGEYMVVLRFDGKKMNLSFVRR